LSTCGGLRRAAILAILAIETASLPYNDFTRQVLTNPLYNSIKEPSKKPNENSTENVSSSKVRKRS
jgi:hypothetical protein